MISVIIPVYNAENTIIACVESVLNQTYSDIELILVDDGSDDNSLQICQKLQKRDSRISVYSKRNGGANSARKLGVKKASGDFINFVDADDTLPDSALENLYKKAMEHLLDIVQGSSYFYSKTGKVIKSSYPQQGEFTSIEFVKLLMAFKASGGPHSNLYRRSLFSDDIFDLEHDVRLREDMYMTLRLGLKSKRVGIYNDIIVYNYTENINSVTHSYIFDSILPFQHLFESMKSHLQEAILFEDVKRDYYSFIIGMCVTACLHNKRLIYDNYVTNISKEAWAYMPTLKDKFLCLMLRNPMIYPMFKFLNETRKFWVNIKTAV